MRNTITRRLWLLCLWLGLTAPAGAQTPTWQWATTPGAGKGQAIAVDRVGNVYTTGDFSISAAFGATTLTSPVSPTVFLAKRLPAGGYAWAVSPTSRGGQSRASGLAVDSAGNVYLTGSFNGTITFGPFTLVSTGYDDVFVVKLTPAGNWAWAVSAGGPEQDYGKGIAIDGSGSVVVTGGFASPAIVFGATTLTNSDGGGLGDHLDAFVTRLTPAGAWQWAVSTGGEGLEVGQQIAVDSSRNIYVTGRFESPAASFGSISLSNSNGSTAIGQPDVFVAKLSPTGVWQWAVRAGGQAYDSALGLAVAADGTAYVGGIVCGTAFFGSMLVMSNGTSDGFVARLSPAGTWEWVVLVSGNDKEAVQALALSESGALCVAGYFRGSVVVGSTVLTGNNNSMDAFVGQLTPARWWQWATSAGGINQDEARGVAADAAGNVYVTGSFEYPAISFGALMLTPLSSSFTNSYVACVSTITGLPQTVGGFTLAPNPARDVVQLTGVPTAIVTLTDGLGRQVRTEAVRAGNVRLDVRGLPAGLYVMRAGAVTRRLVVE